MDAVDGEVVYCRNTRVGVEVGNLNQEAVWPHEEITQSEVLRIGPATFGNPKRVTTRRGNPVGFSITVRISSHLDKVLYPVPTNEILNWFDRGFSGFRISS